MLSLAMFIAGAAVAGCGDMPDQGGPVGVAGSGEALKDSDRDGHDDFDDFWRLGNNGKKHGKNKCPIVQAFATPPVIKVGQTTQLKGFATDPDNRPKKLTYNWTVSPATVGTIANPTSKRTNFKCLNVGVAKITFFATDGDCVRTADLKVYCMPGTQTSCGDGAKNGTETCDDSSPNAADKCPTTCADTNTCTTDVLTGSAGQCNVQCTHTPVTACTSGDTCCPSGCKNPQDNDCAPFCGDGAKNGTESCDDSSSSKCPTPTTCSDGVACTTDVITGSATTCSAVCGHTAITACTGGDGCCAPGCSSANDSDCAPTCGDGAKNGSEKCDNSSPVAADKCPASCDDNIACTTDSTTGSAAQCSLVCGHAPVTACTSGDGCCAPGCKNPANGGTDSDCAAAPTCGDGIKEASETCDDSSPTKCPTSCADTDQCTTDTMSGTAATCNVTCGHAPITTCSGATGDGCCAAGCTTVTDKDCAPSCGDGAKNGQETCDNSSSVAADKCPASCADADSCTTDTTTGSAAACSLTCGHTAITACTSGDGCCAPGCKNPANGGTDSDCAPTSRCGDGIVDPSLGETCDGNCPTTCNDNNSCTTDTLTGSANLCNVVCKSTAVTVCSPTLADQCCPSGCTANTDADCLPVCGNSSIETGETCDPNSTCPTACNDGVACTTDTLTGDPTKCTSMCVSTAITACINNDGCCGPNCRNPQEGGTDNDCPLHPPACGDGAKNGSETCDDTSPNPADKCPTTCNDNIPCTQDVMSGFNTTCNVVCTHPTITACTGAVGDGCCPGDSHAVGNACNATNDIDCGTFCGNGVKESGELCDGADCATAASCNDGNACTIDTVTGSVATCDAVCTHTASTTPACLCGNGHLDSGELCDGNCPTPATCDDGNPCTNDIVTGSATTCDAVCTHSAVTTPACLCGNGALDSGEKCDNSTANNKCPTSCSPADGCNPSVLTGSALTCSAACTSQPVLVCGPVTAPKDNCCLSACSSATDQDCAPANACDQCEHQGRGTNNCPSSRSKCDNLQGVTGGTFAPGLSKAQLCKDILTCIHTTQCASNFNDTDCLCGIDVPSGACFAGTFAAMTGPCSDLMAKGAETNVPAQLSLRFSDADFAVGAAITVVENCDYTECTDECLFSFQP